MKVYSETAFTETHFWLLEGWLFNTLAKKSTKKNIGHFHRLRSRLFPLRYYSIGFTPKLHNGLLEMVWNVSQRMGTVPHNDEPSLSLIYSFLKEQAGIRECSPTYSRTHTIQRHSSSNILINCIKWQVIKPIPTTVQPYYNVFGYDKNIHLTE